MTTLNAFVPKAEHKFPEEFWSAVDEFLEDRDNAYHRVWASWGLDKTDDAEDCTSIIGKYLRERDLTDGTVILLDNTW